MSDYSAIISEIKNANTFAEISQVVSSFSASAVGSGEILHSGKVGFDLMAICETGGRGKTSAAATWSAVVAERPSTRLLLCLLCRDIGRQVRCKAW